MKHFYETNDDLLNHPINKKFEDILWMSDDEFTLWVRALRHVIVDIWDNKGVPPKMGLSEDEIVEQFNKLMTFDVLKFETIDELTGQKDCVRNTNQQYGTAVNQWFENMLRTKINYKESGTGVSIYDLTADKKYFQTQYKALYRNLKKDGFYQYSTVVEANNKDHCLIWTDSAVDWIKQFENTKRIYETHDYFLSERKDDYTGNSQTVKLKNFLILTGLELKTLSDIIPKKCLTLIKDFKDDSEFYVRFFKYGQKLFPGAFKSWKVAVVQQPVNFPVLTAKWLYQKYTEEFKEEEKILIWDCSAGWAGRILGAMAVMNDRNIHYIGNDPNTDNWPTEEYSKYHDVANFYNTKTIRADNVLFPHNHSCEVYCLGSEEMRNLPEFQEHKGKLSIAGTSSPYFNREQYSDEETQSYKKFSQYESWRDGFLKPTIETIAEWLRPGGYAWWNTADLKVGKTFLRLEEDSTRFFEECGLKYRMTWKMTMSPMPGAGRTAEGQQSTFKNFCQVNGKIVKFEPIRIFQKPLKNK
jgi:hypothetical protein